MDLSKIIKSKKIIVYPWLNFFADLFAKSIAFQIDFFELFAYLTHGIALQLLWRSFFLKFQLLQGNDPVHVKTLLNRSTDLDNSDIG
jgi:hypothetical protein